MKTLLIMRHAKSSWKQEGQPDHDRPLNDRGKRDAPRMGHLLAEEGILPDRILCSSAKRARKTAAAVAEVLKCEDRLELHDDLYSAAPALYVKLLRELPEDVNTVLIVGHDPAMTEFASELSGNFTEMPTAAIACFTIPIAYWKALSPGIKCELRGHWLPRNLQG